MAVAHIYLKIIKKDHSELDKKILKWKEKFEFIFISLMAVLLIYLFNPRTDKSLLIDHETKILLYLFGFVLLVTADWGEFINDSILLASIQETVGLGILV
jgi:hypothetical protein